MGAIQEIFQRFAPEYLTRFGEQIPYQHHRVIEAICQCRTEATGSVCYQCEDCGQPHLVPAACGNRHCPSASSVSHNSGSNDSCNANYRILKIEANAVSFSYKKPGSARLRTLTLDPLEFLRRFLSMCCRAGS